MLACRDITKAERAAEDIRRSTGNKNVVVYILDLASLKSVRKCANEVISKESRLDVLINNAGIYFTWLLNFELMKCRNVVADSVFW